MMRREVFVCIIVVILFAGVGWADTVYMNDGRALKGEIVKEETDSVHLKMQYGIAKLNRSEIKEIEYGPVEEEKEEKKAESAKSTKKRLTKGQIEKLIAQLGSDESVISDRAAELLKDAGEGALGDLRAALAGSGEQLKARIEELLERICGVSEGAKKEARAHLAAANKLVQRFKADLDRLVESGLGRSSAMEQLIEPILGYYKKAIELDPNFLKAIVQLGKYQIALEQYSEAADVIEKALQWLPEDKWVLHNLSFSYQEMKQYKKALKYGEELVKCHPECAESRIWLGQLCLRMKSYRKAIAAMEKAIELGDNFYATYSNLALAYGNMKKFGKAIEKQTEALKQKPGDEYLLLKLVEYYLSNKESDETVKRFEECEKLHPTGDASLARWRRNLKERIKAAGKGTKE